MSATRLIFISFESIISDVIVSPFKKEPFKVLLLMNNSNGKPATNPSVIILGVPTSIIAVAPDEEPVIFLLFNDVTSKCA